MNFLEAVRLFINKGKKIRRIPWDQSTYLDFLEDQKFFYNDKSPYTYPVYGILAEDWEIYQEKPKTYSFIEALKAFNEGKNIKSIDRTYWFNRKHDYEYEEIFTLKDVNATDWIIEEGD